MSQPDDGLTQVLHDILTGNYVNCAMMCLVLYEFVVTFDQEVEVGWKRKFTATSLLLLATRWLMVLGPIVTFVPVGPTGCSTIYAFIDLSFMAAVAVISLFSALRVYALWQASSARYAYAAVVLMLGLVPVWTNIYLWTRTSIEYVELPLFSTCTTWSALPDKTNNALLYFTRGCAIASDVVVLVLTWIKSLSQFREMRQLKMGSSVSTILLRDGTIYFVALLVMNILQVVTYSTGLAGGAAYAIVFLQALPPLLVQRFMLNLRQLSAPPVDSAAANVADLSRFSVHFRVPSDFLGNIGEPLAHGDGDGGWRSEPATTLHDSGDTRFTDEPQSCVDELPAERLEPA